VRILLRYGKGDYPLELPDDWNVTVLHKKTMPVLDEPVIEIDQALDARLPEVAAGCQSACILICDVTRPVPNGLILPVLIRRLLEGGIAQDKITILVATGLHRPNRGDELREVVGDDWVYRNIRIENHFALRDEDHVDLGTTGRGTPILLDRRFVEADLRLAVGLVEPHFMAGYSGGRKLVAPGVAHETTIRKFHSAAMLDHALATNCRLDGNPLHEELMEIAGKVAPVYGLNVVLNEEREIAFLNFGELIAAHYEAAAFAADFAEVPVDETFRTVIASAAGYPLDATYYQTVKGMVSASEVLAPQGALFIASACNEGLGSEDYRRAQQRLMQLGADGFLKDIHSRDRAEIDEWQTQMQIRAMKTGAIHLFTQGLSTAEKDLTGVNCVDSLERAVIEWVGIIRDTNVAVIPEGPYLVPRCTVSGRVFSIFK